MLTIKEGVGILGLRPELLLAGMVVHSVYLHYGYDCVITEITGGKHMAHSLHYKGLAIDIRTRNIKENHLGDIVQTLKAALGESYDVVLESTHLHVEFDPK